MNGSDPTGEDYEQNIVRPPQFSTKALSSNGNISTSFHLSSDIPEQPRRDESMDDKDVKRLEDRIEAVNREGQLRLDALMARIEGQVGRIAEQTASIAREVGEQRADNRALRSDLQAEVHAGVEGIKKANDDKSSQERSRFYTLAGLIITVGLGLGALYISMKQVWVMGVQTGQTLQANSPPPLNAN